MTTERGYRIYPIAVSELVHTDLRRTAAALLGDLRGNETEDEIATMLDSATEPTLALAYRLAVDGVAQTGDVLVDVRSQRVGIALGADADWGDLDDPCDLTTAEGRDRLADAVSAAVHDWLANSEAWASRA
jgi:hypothetical protein